MLKKKLPEILMSITKMMLLLLRSFRISKKKLPEILTSSLRMVIIRWKMTKKLLKPLQMRLLPEKMRKLMLSWLRK
jgi:hypothetical protein